MAFHPLTMARHTSEGRWKGYPHLAHLGSKLYDLAAGKITRLMVMCPPRHGKSMLCSQYFPAWFLGTFPDSRVILSSYEADFAAQWGRKARDLMEGWGREMFGLSVRDTSHAANRWDIAGHEGGMVTAGARGPITGKGMDLGIIDDPTKNDEEAASEVYREKIWEWYLSTFSTRLQRGGRVLVIMTRWHEDDLCGRLLKAQEEGGDRWDVVRLPALAEENETTSFFKRKEGEALCPELIPKKMLEETRDRLGTYWWSTLYQQRPFPRGGGFFKRDSVEVVEHVAENRMMVRGWDLAASKTGKRTAGVLMSKGPDDSYVVHDVVMGKWEPAQRDGIIRRTAEADGRGVPVRIEQEPGSGGIAQVHAIVRNLQGWSVEGVKATGSKEVRADPVASQVNVGNVKILAGNWNEEFLSEMEAFPNGKYLDQVDAMSLCFDYLSTKRYGHTIGRPKARELPEGIPEELTDTRNIFGRDWRDSMPL